MPRSITSVDAVFALTIPGVYNFPVVLQGWSTDDMFDLEAVPKVETRMGVDGVLSAGFVIHPRKMKLKLEASSESQQIFDDWASAMDALEDALGADATITLFANGTQYACTNGHLTGYKDVTDAKKTLQPLSYEITWESVQKAAL